MRHNGGSRDMGGMRNGNSGGMHGEMKRRWDNAATGGGNDYQNKRPFPPTSHFPSNGAPPSNGSYAPKPAYRSMYDQNKPPMTSAPPSYQQQSYQQQPYQQKYPGYAPMQMPPTLSSYQSPIASAIANYVNFPPPQGSMPPLPKN